MRISVVMATYNRPASVGRALRSVAEQQRDGLDLEVVIVDDSTDNTLDVAREALAEFPSCRLITHHAGTPRLRTNGARNLGLELSSGDLCILLDSDDELMPGALDYIANFFDSHEHFDLLFASVKNKSGRPRRGDPRLLDREVTYEQLVSSEAGEFLPIVRRDVFRRSGIRFPQQLIGFEAVAWYGLARAGHRYFMSSKALRLYDDQGDDRTTNAEFRLTKAAQFATGHVLLLEMFGEDIRRVNPRAYRKKLLKAMLYNRLAETRDSTTDQFLRQAGGALYRVLEGVPRVVARRMFHLGVRLDGAT